MKRNIVSSRKGDYYENLTPFWLDNIFKIYLTNYPESSYIPGTYWYIFQGCGSGSGLDPYSIGSVDPDPYSESGSGSRRAKMTHKSRKKLVKVHGFEVLDGLF